MVYERADTEGNDSMVIERDMDDDADFSIAQCSQIKEKCEVRKGRKSLDGH